MGADSARRPGRTSGQVSCLLVGGLTRIRPVVTGAYVADLSQAGMILFAVRPVSCLCHGMDLSFRKMKPRREAERRPVLAGPLGRACNKEDRNEGGRQMAAMERTDGPPAKHL